MMSSSAVRPFSHLPKFFMEILTSSPARKSRRAYCPTRSSLLSSCSTVLRFLARSDGRARAAIGEDEYPSLELKGMPFPVADVEEALMGFIAGKRKATEVAHSVWKNFIRGGDIVVDATCGNGYDTLAMLKLIADESGRGCVYGLDIQKSALENTSWLLRQSVKESEGMIDVGSYMEMATNSLVIGYSDSDCNGLQWEKIDDWRALAKLSLLCHSRMEEIVPNDRPVRLIAFNLGFLPGGDKTIITKPHTTLLALQAASRMLGSEGFMSIVVYVGHPGGREEFETVLSFTSSLPAESWVSFKFETVTRSNGPVFVFIFKK